MPWLRRMPPSRAVSTPSRKRGYRSPRSGTLRRRNDPVVVVSWCRYRLAPTFCVSNHGCDDSPFLEYPDPASERTALLASAPFIEPGDTGVTSGWAAKIQAIVLLLLLAFMCLNYLGPIDETLTS